MHVLRVCAQTGPIRFIFETSHHISADEVDSLDKLGEIMYHFDLAATPLPEHA